MVGSGVMNYSDMSLHRLSEMSKVYGEKKLEQYKTDLKDTLIEGIHSEKIVYNKKCLEQLLTDIKKIYPSMINLQLDKEILLIDAYESATIEGARTTLDEVKHSLVNKKNTKDTFMVQDSLLASRLAYSDNFVFDLEGVCNVWKVVTQNVCENRGQQLTNSKFRTGMVYISSGTELIHTPEKPENIEKKLNLFLKKLEQLDENIFVKAALLHFYLVYIHPFCDGNGRTARICFNSYLYHNGITNINKVAMSKYINKDRNNYYKSLTESEKGAKIDSSVYMDVTPAIYYMLATLKEAMENVILLQNKLSAEEEKKFLLKCRKGEKVLKLL